MSYLISAGCRWHSVDNKRSILSLILTSWELFFPNFEGKNSWGIPSFFFLLGIKSKPWPIKFSPSKLFLILLECETMVNFKSEVTHCVTADLRCFSVDIMMMRLVFRAQHLSTAARKNTHKSLSFSHSTLLGCWEYSVADSKRDISGTCLFMGGGHPLHFQSSSTDKYNK